MNLNTINKNTATLHSQWSHGPTYLYSQIDYALFLLARDESLSHVNILLHPVSPLYGLTNIILILRAHIVRPKSWIKFFYLLGRVWPFKSKSIAKDDIKINTTSAIGSSDCKSIYNILSTSSETILLNTRIGTISLARACYWSNFSWFTNYFVCSLATNKLLASCYVKGRLDLQRLLHLRYNNVLIGDLVCSHALRTWPASGGSLEKCNNLILRAYTFKAVSVCLYIENNFTNFLVNTFVASPEPTYIHSIHKRIFHKLGASVVNSDSLDFRLEILSCEQELQYPKVKSKGLFDQLRADHIALVRQNLEGRISNKTKLWYMFNGSNQENADGIFTIDGVLLSLEKTKSCAIIFLHSFDDGQYFYGLDSFLDLFEWVTFTIDTLIANEACDCVMVKQHPNTCSGCPGDVVAFNNLLKKYTCQEKVFFIDPTTNIRNFLHFDSCVGITHHGSVAEELVYLKIPVIGSFFAPWQDNYKFLSVWSNKDEYYTLLIASFSRSCDVSSFQEKELLRYIYDYRIDVLSIYDSSAWLKYYRLCCNKLIEITKDNFRLANELFEDMTFNDLTNNHFLDYLASFHELQLKRLGAPIISL